ncbi:MAG TPA: FAD-dependent oxidoreductase [Pseudonocardiaceae bacterium]|nr:FAD-dependent oxidoreductase [Pseudonocardiaceae bacterium]
MPCYAEPTPSPDWTPLPGLREAQPWTSREVTNTDASPRRLVVLGGDVVGCEMAQAMRGLGSEQVTIVHRGQRLLERHEPLAGELLATAFAEAGISVLTGRSPGCGGHSGAVRSP